MNLPMVIGGTSIHMYILSLNPPKLWDASVYMQLHYLC